MNLEKNGWNKNIFEISEYRFVWVKCTKYNQLYVFGNNK